MNFRMLGKVIAWIALLGLRTTAQHYDNRKITQMAGMPSVQNHFWSPRQEILLALHEYSSRTTCIPEQILETPM